MHYFQYTAPKFNHNGISAIAFSAISGRDAVAMWGYRLWLFLGLRIVMVAAPELTAERINLVVIAWAFVFVVFAIAFVVDYSVLPLIDHRYRAVFYPGDKLAAALTQRFHAAPGRKLSYVIGSMGYFRRVGPREGR